MGGNISPVPVVVVGVVVVVAVMMMRDECEMSSWRDVKL